MDSERAAVSHVPALIDMADLAAACPVDFPDARAARRAMQRAGIAEKLGRNWKVGDGRLRELLPDVYDRVYVWFERRAKEGPREPVRANEDTVTGA